MTATMPTVIKDQSSTTLLGTILPSVQGRKWSITLCAVLVGVVAFTLAARINLPVWPVPVTLQSFAVALVAAVVGMKIGVASVALYLLAGALGLPVFAAGGTINYLVGPTGGFLMGFLAQAAIIGYAADHGATQRPFVLFASMMLGNLTMFAVGFAWLVLMAGAQWVDQGNMFASAFSKAVQPFVIWDVLKMALAALGVSGAWVLLIAPEGETAA
jgi:biotin transport system substrate-specific component